MTDPAVTIRLMEIEKRLQHVSTAEPEVYDDENGVIFVDVLICQCAGPDRFLNSKFIANAPADIAWLIRELRKRIEGER